LRVWRRSPHHFAVLYLSLSFPALGCGCANFVRLHSSARAAPETFQSESCKRGDVIALGGSLVSRNCFAAGPLWSANLGGERSRLYSVAPRRMAMRSTHVAQFADIARQPYCSSARLRPGSNFLGRKLLRRAESFAQKVFGRGRMSSTRSRMRARRTA